MFFHKGVIALDIDGTVTSQTDDIPHDVIAYFYQLHQAGWLFVFITGRPFQWSIRSLHSLPFPYLLSVQNGALLLDMPQEKIIARHYLSTKLLSPMQAICLREHTDFVIYAGFEHQDQCYYRPQCLPPSLLNYLLKRTARLEEKWRAIGSFNELTFDHFAAIKCFAKEKEAFRLSSEIEKQLGLHAPPIRDPFSPEYFVVQATHPRATKGGALRDYITVSQLTGPIIAAGDDHNDVSLLKQATIKIAMANAPKALLEMADIIAPVASQKGIIQGLSKALEAL